VLVGLVDEDAGGDRLEVLEDVLGQGVEQLLERKVQLGLNLVVQELRRGGRDETGTARTAKSRGRVSDRAEKG
jgi:hypothetical protein